MYVFVADPPDSNTNTLLILDTRPCHPLIHLRLRLQLLRCSRRIKPHIELRISKANAQVREALHRRLQRLQVRRNGIPTAARGFAGQVRLGADAVDGLAVGLDELDDAAGAGGFGALLDVVVVVEELGVRGVLFGEAEGHGEVGFADGVVPDGGAECAVFIESCGEVLDVDDGRRELDAEREREILTFVDYVPV